MQLLLSRFDVLEEDVWVGNIEADLLAVFVVEHSPVSLELAAVSAQNLNVLELRIVERARVRHFLAMLPCSVPFPFELPDYRVYSQPCQYVNQPSTNNHAPALHRGQPIQHLLGTEHLSDYPGRGSVPGLLIDLSTVGPFELSKVGPLQVLVGVVEEVLDVELPMLGGGPRFFGLPEVGSPSASQSSDSMDASGEHIKL